MPHRDRSIQGFLAAGLLTPSLLAQPGGVVDLWDELDTHLWIAENWGAALTVDHVRFDGHQCLQAMVADGAAPWAALRTQKFPLEDWSRAVAAVRADVHVLNGEADTRLKLETRDSDFEIITTAQSPPLADDVWQTVTWPVDSNPGLSAVSAMTLILENVHAGTTVFVDDLRLVLTDASEVAWDALDFAWDWNYDGNWVNWSDLDPDFWGTEPVAAGGAPDSPAAGLFVQWDYEGGEMPFHPTAEVGVDAQFNPGFSFDFTGVDRVRASVKCSVAGVPLRLFLWDADTETGFVTATYSVDTADAWQEVTWFIPWPGDFDVAGVEAFKFVVSGIDQHPTGTARFDHISFIANEGCEPAECGRWLDPEPWPVTAIHAAVLPTGKVLMYAYPEDTPGSQAHVWDPVTDTFEIVPFDADVFCSGHAFLADGRLHISGGNIDECVHGGLGLPETHIFDPVAGVVTPLDDMATGRWYPTAVTLGDGRILIVSGLDEACGVTPIMELYTPGVGLDVVPEGERAVPIYPRLHLLSSGHVAHVGIESGTSVFELGAGWQEDIAFTNFAGQRDQGTSVLLPGRADQVIVIGGEDNGVVTGTCEIIDFADPTPAWRWTDSLNFARAHANVVILPDRNLLLLGGGETDLYGNPINFAELFDAELEAWTLLPPQVHGRMYHSIAVLLPDGRVLSAGQDEGQSELWGEIYEPAYLHRGTRPTIACAPPRITYGRTFGVQTPDGASIDSIALIGLSTVTHSVNNGQRYAGLDFGLTDGHLVVTAPPGGNHAPPGYYMLFIVDADGVPSVAEMVQLVPDACAADVDGSGAVDVDDLVEVILAWTTDGLSSCGVDADIVEDGIVNVSDLVELIVSWGTCP